MESKYIFDSVVDIPVTTFSNQLTFQNIKTETNNKYFDCSDDILLYQCDTCPDFQTSSFAQLNQHIREGHTEKKPNGRYHRCMICDFTTYSKYIFLQHRLFDSCDNIKTEIDLKFNCKLCDYESKWNNDLTTHVTLEHLKFPSDREFCCKFCPVKYNARTSLIQHLKFNHADSETEHRFECTQCDYTTIRKTNLHRHIMTKHTDGFEKCFDCKICDSKFTNKPYLLKHMYAVHNKSTKLRRLQCPFCTYQARWNCEIQKHVISKHTPADQIPWVYCNICQGKFNSRKNLNAHIRYHHSDKTRNPGVKHIFQCPHCEHSTGRKADLKLHILSKHSSRDDVDWFQCELCPSKFITKKYLRQHMFRHKPEESLFKCEECPYVGRYKSDLRSHIEVRHTPKDEITWFYCTQCPKKYRDRKTLKSHLLICNVKSEDIEWLCCDVCDYKTVQKAALKRHQKRNHSDDIKWFECDLCSFKTKFKFSLESHQLKKHDKCVRDTFLQCEHCPFRALYQGVLNQHMKIHSQDTNQAKDAEKREIHWFACEQCDYKSKVKRGLSEHVKRCKKIKEVEGMEQGLVQCIKVEVEENDIGESSLEEFN